MLCLAESPQPTKPGSTQPSEGSHRQEGLHLVIKNWKGRVNCKDKGKMDSPNPWYSHSAEKLTNPLITGGWRALKLEASRVHKDGEWGLWEKHYLMAAAALKRQSNSTLLPFPVPRRAHFIQFLAENSSPFRFSASETRWAGATTMPVP